MCPFLVVCTTSITGVILTTCIFVFLDPRGQNPLLFSPIDLVVTSALLLATSPPDRIKIWVSHRGAVLYDLCEFSA